MRGVSHVVWPRGKPYNPNLRQVQGNLMGAIAEARLCVDAELEMPAVRASRLRIASLPRTAEVLPASDLLLMLFRWLWPIPFVALAWWGLSKLPRDAEPDAEPQWDGRSLRFPLDPLDKVSLAILVGLWFFVWLGRNSIFPVPPDSYYHLMVAQHVYDTHSVPIWNSWEWQPLGRPHLYPPLYHILLAFAAVPFHGDLMAAFQNLQPAMLPFAHFTTWYLARWLFGSRRALLALLIVGMDPVLVTSSALGMPGVLVTSWISLLVVFFLSGRWVLASAMLALAFYTHLGIPALALAGLAIFSLLQRRYLLRFCAMTAIAVALAAPWLLRIYVFRDWFSHPLDQGLYGEIEPWKLPFVKFAWLQMVNVFLILPVLFALPRIRWRETRNQVLLCLLLGCLPMLFSYGGRYYIHTVHLWAIFAALPFTGFLGEPLRWRRVVAVALLALCPAPSLIGQGTPFASGVYPMPSAWLVSPVVAAGGLRYFDGGGRLGFVSLDDCRVVSDEIKARTEPDQIVSLTWDRDLGVAIGFLSGHPIDTGAWEETMPNELSRDLIRWYAFHDPTACYLSRFGYGVPHGIPERRVAGLYLGIREPVDEEGGAIDAAKKAERKKQRKSQRKQE